MTKKQVVIGLSLALFALLVSHLWQGQGSAQASPPFAVTAGAPWTAQWQRLVSLSTTDFEAHEMTTGLPKTGDESVHRLRVRAYNCLRKDPSSSSCRELFLQTLHYEKERGLSLKHFAECAEQEPNNSLCHFARAILEMMDGGASRAQEPLQDLLHTAYRSVWADFALGKFYQLIGEPSLSNQYFSLACKSGVRFSCQQVNPSHR